jgi:hypothetical protein
MLQSDSTLEESSDDYAIALASDSAQQSEDVKSVKSVAIPQRWTKEEDKKLKEVIIIYH